MKYILCLLCLVLFAFCLMIIFKPESYITKVELARSGAWTDRGGAISVDKSLHYNFYYTYTGPGGKPMSGYYIGEVTKSFWDSLSRKLEDVDFKNIPVSDKNMNAADVNHYEMIITWKSGKRRILRTDLGAPDPVLNMMRWFNNSYKRIHFSEESKSPFKFETTFQNPLNWKALGIDIDTMRFLPPVKKKALN